MSQTFQRRPGGEPAGGQFADRQRPDGDTNLVDPDVRNAESPRTPKDRLCDLAESANPEVRSAVAANPRCEPEVRQFLAYDDNPAVRASLLQLDELEDHIVHDLANDSDQGVRAAAAAHPRATVHQLTILTADDFQAVRDAAELELHRRGVDAEARRAEMIDQLEATHRTFGD